MRKKMSIGFRIFDLLSWVMVIVMIALSLLGIFGQDYIREPEPDEKEQFMQSGPCVKAVVCVKNTGLMKINPAEISDFEYFGSRGDWYFKIEVGEQIYAYTDNGYRILTEKAFDALTGQIRASANSEDFYFGKGHSTQKSYQEGHFSRQQIQWIYESVKGEYADGTD